jgi:hypothetical protein
MSNLRIVETSGDVLNNELFEDDDLVLSLESSHEDWLRINTEFVFDMSYMFSGSRALDVDVRNWDISSVVDINNF